MPARSSLFNTCPSRRRPGVLCVLRVAQAKFLQGWLAGELQKFAVYRDERESQAARAAGAFPYDDVFASLSSVSAVRGPEVQR